MSHRTVRVHQKFLSPSRQERAQYLTRRINWKKVFRATRPALLCASPKTNIRVKSSSQLLVPHLGDLNRSETFGPKRETLSCGDSIQTRTFLMIGKRCSLLGTTAENPCIRVWCLLANGVFCVHLMILLFHPIPSEYQRISSGHRDTGYAMCRSL